MSGQVRSLWLAFLLGACAPTSPYVSEWPVTKFHVSTGSGLTGSWGADNRTGTVLTVHNPTGERRVVVVRCLPRETYGSPIYSDMRWTVCLPAHAERRRLVEFTYVDARNRVCAVEREWREDTCEPGNWEDR